MGLLYTLYDHVYYRGTNEAGETLGVQEYRTSQEVKSLFAFGQEPDAFEGTEVEPDKIYTAEIDGRTVTRRLNQVNEIHPKPQGDTAGLTYSVRHHLRGKPAVQGGLSLLSVGSEKHPMGQSPDLL